MERITVTIEGTTPLLCNRFTDARQLSATNGGATAQASPDRGTPLEQAKERLYIGADGAPMIPQPNIFRCLIDAGSYFKVGRTKVTTQKSSMIPAYVEIPGVEIAIAHKEPWTVDTRAVRIPATGGRILCHRPCFHDWTLTFDLLFDESMFNARVLREIVDAAGRRVGLGDFRPACKGPFGKFVVTAWQAEEKPARAA